MTRLFSEPNPELMPQVPQDPTTVCPQCGGKELIFLDDGSAKRCPCTLVDTRIQRLRAARIPNKYVTRTFDTFNTKVMSTGFKPQFEAIRGYAETFSDIGKLEKKGLLFTGGVGTGKTHLAVAVMQQVIENGSTAVFWNTVDFFQALRGCMSPDSPVSEDDLLNKARTADLLVFDDLGTEKTSDWVLDRLYMLVNSRYQDDRPIIVTTNQNSSELSDRVGHRIVSRLLEMCIIVQFNGKDYRRENLR